MRVWVGTSGFHYRHWRGRFYPVGLPTDRWLAWYVERYATVELNAPFYRLPPASTFAHWAAIAPDGFRYAVKMSRYLTHVLRLRDPRGPVELLLERCAPLGEHLGPLLLQLPPDLEAAPDRLAATLSAIPPGIQVAVEPRHASWWSDEVQAVLRAHGEALCWADRRGPVTPDWATTDWRYLRYHEGTGEPRPCYGADAFTRWLRRLAADAPATTDAWVYFNNDPNGCAIVDADRSVREAGELGLDVVRPGGAPAATRPPSPPAPV
ncbi:MAG: DUF72 domain-containing protein [Chloroflexota bacterium]